MREREREREKEKKKNITAARSNNPHEKRESAKIQKNRSNPIAYKQRINNIQLNGKRLTTIVKELKHPLYS